MTRIAYITRKDSSRRKANALLTTSITNLLVLNVKEFNKLLENGSTFDMIYLESEISDIEHGPTEARASQWWNQVYSRSKLTLPISKDLMVNILLKHYANSLQDIMLPRTVVFTTQNKSYWKQLWKSTVHNSRGQRRLKPSLNNSGRGHLTTAIWKGMSPASSALYFIQKELSRCPNGVVICQSSVRPFVETKIVMFRSEIAHVCGPNPESSSSNNVLKRVMAHLSTFSPELPDVWRLDLVLHNNSVYLNEIEIIGAEYIFCDSTGSKINLQNAVTSERIKNLLTVC